MGVPRVNGQLSMTRAFGNGVHKRTGGPQPEALSILLDYAMLGIACVWSPGPDPRDRPVTALPQLQVRCFAA